MNRIIRTVWLSALVLLIAACAGPKVEQDYKPGTDFDHSWTRYDWRGGQSQIPGVGHDRLQRVAEKALAAHGYRLDPDNPEFHVDLNGLTRPVTGGQKSLGLSIGLPVGRHGSVGIGGSKSLDNQRQEGVLIVDISDAATRELIWRGSASGIPLRDFELGREQQLRRALDKLFSQFPPQ